jgi:2-dehydro-3-deoxyphosphogluconate aldolase/(4S)-4-hydroxy-2-oxoglutarate aldolase
MSDAPLARLLSGHRIVPVVTLEQAELAPRLGEALLAGGLGIVEVTLRSAAGLAALRALKAAHPQMTVAAGTVLRPEQMRAAAEAGADFAVSPGGTPALIEAAAAIGLPYMPGVATASEAMAAQEAGQRVLKFFPAAPAGGSALLKSLAEPLSELRFCPTGGVRPETLNDYLALPNVICVGGTWIAPKAALAEGDWAGIAARAAEAMALCKES